MNPKAIAISLTASLLLSTGCAAKNRWFSRKDYSEVQDPFMESSEVAAAEEDSDDNSGRARLGSSTAVADNGPKPIARPVANTAAVATSPSAGSRATAAYPDETSEASGAKKGIRSLSGSNLSQFLNSGGKSLPSETAAVEGAGGPSPNLADPKSASARPSAGALSPAARAATMPTLEEEEASFAGFMQKQTNAVNSVAQKAAGKVQETENSAADFASWANQQKAQWSQEGQNAVESAKAAPAAARKKVRAVSHEAQTAVDNAAADFMNAAEFDNAELAEEQPSGEDAEPLFNEPSAKSASTRKKAQSIPTEDDAEFEFGAASGASKTADPAVESNPFENPFDMPDEQPTKPPVSKKSATSAKKASRPTIDESFGVDSGWKPSGVTPP